MAIEASSGVLGFDGDPVIPFAEIPHSLVLAAEGITAVSIILMLAAFLNSLPKGKH